MQADLENVTHIGPLKMQAIRWGHCDKCLDASKLFGDRHLFVQASGESWEVSQRCPRASHEEFRGFSFRRCLPLSLATRLNTAGPRPARGEADLIEQQLREKRLGQVVRMQ